MPFSKYRKYLFIDDRDYDENINTNKIPLGTKENLSDYYESMEEIQGYIPQDEIELVIRSPLQKRWTRFYLLRDDETILEETPNVKWMYGISEDWVEKGGYWYYTKPLKKNTEVDFCKGIHSTFP